MFTPNNTICKTLRIPAQGAAVPNVSVVVAIPSDLQVVSSTPSVGTYASGVWTIPTLSPGADATITLCFGYADSEVCPTSKSITATIGTTVSETDLGNNAVTFPLEYTTCCDFSECLPTETLSGINYYTDPDTANQYSVITYVDNGVVRTETVLLSAPYTVETVTTVPATWVPTTVSTGGGVSTDPGNSLSVGSDGGVFYEDNNPVLTPSTDAGNDITLGSDGGVFFQDQDTPVVLVADGGNPNTVGSNPYTLAGGNHLESENTVDTTTFNVVGPLADIGDVPLPTDAGEYELVFDKATETFSYELIEAPGEVKEYDLAATYPENALVNVDGIIYQNVSGADNTAPIPGIGWQQPFSPKTVYPTTFDRTEDGWGSSVRTTCITGNLEVLDITPSIGTPPTGEFFMGGCSTGKYIVLAPQNSEFFVRVDIITNEILTLPAPYPRVTDGANFNDKFNGAVYDGEFVWVIPSWSAPMVKIDPETFTIVAEIPNFNTVGDDAYNGGLAIPQFNRVYACPHMSTDLKWVNTLDNTTGTTDLSGISNISAGSRSFLNIVFDGSVMWLLPRRAGTIVGIDPATGVIIADFPHPLAGIPSPSIGYFHGGTYDGRNIWMTPLGTDQLCWFDTIDRFWKSKPHNASVSSQAFLGSVMVNGSIYFPAFKASESLLVNPRTEGLTYIPRGTPQDTPVFVIDTGNKLYHFQAQGPEIYVKNRGFVEASIEDLATRTLIVHGEVDVVAPGLPYLFNNSPAKVLGLSSIAPYTGIGYSFSGSEHINTTPNTVDFATNNAGVIFMEYEGVAGAQANPRFINSGTGFTAADGLSLFINENSGRFTFVANGNSIVSSLSTVPTSGLHRIAVAFSDTTAVLYLDGVIVGSGSANYIPPTSPNDLVIGNFLYAGNDRPFDRTLLKAVIYDNLLSAQKLADITSGVDTDFSTSQVNIDFSVIELGSQDVSGFELRGSFTDQDGSKGTQGDVLVRNMDGGLSYSSNPAIIEINMANARVSVGTPLIGTHAATKDYVDIATQFLKFGVGSPENTFVAPVGTLYVDTAGGAGTTLYVKESGTGNIGWVAK